MTDRYTRIVLTIIALNLTILSFGQLFKLAFPEALAQSGTMDVRVVGGTLDYETDTHGGPTLKVCTQC
jgi:hypothetical protein